MRLTRCGLLLRPYCTPRMKKRKIAADVATE
jgi:hypothetical protein